VAPDGLEYPRIVLIDLSTACNATCVMCPTQLNPLRKKLISKSVFDAIVDQVSVLPSNEMFFIGVHGEPLLDKRLADKVAQCRSRGLDYVLISTNGSLLSEQRARELLEAGPHIVTVSLESMDPAVFESIRKGLVHREIVENLQSLFAIRDELGSKTRIAIRFIESQRNANERASFVAYWDQFLNKEKGDYFAIDRIHNWGYGDPSKFHGNTSCPHTDYTTILSDGNVVFCCLDHEGVHLIGNITERPLLDIYNGEKARSLRNIHRSGQRHTLEMCKTCDVAEQWAGTPLDPLYSDFQAADWVRMPAGV